MPLCFNLIACSSGDNSAVSDAVNPVWGITWAIDWGATGVGCGGKGGVFISGVLIEAIPTSGVMTGILPLKSFFGLS